MRGASRLQSGEENAGKLLHGPHFRFKIRAKKGFNA
jgi:hypothetical protein